MHRDGRKNGSKKYAFTVSGCDNGLYCEMKYMRENLYVIVILNVLSPRRCRLIRIKQKQEETFRLSQACKKGVSSFLLSTNR